MNDSIPITADLARALAIETAIVVALAAGLQALTNSAYWRRTIWQVATLGVAALVILEITGLARGLVAWTGSMSQPVPNPSALTLALSRREREPQATGPGHSDFPAAIAARGSSLATTASDTRGGDPFPLSHPMGEGRGEGPSRIANPTPAPSAGSFGWLGPLWLLGFGVVLSRLALGCGLLWWFRWRRGRRGQSASQQVVESLARRVGLRRRVRVITSRGLSGPIAFGILCPTVGVPENCDFNPAQQKAMLAHELAHLAARDPLWQLLANGVSAALWWHPLVWWLRHELRAASETAADEASLLLHGGPGILAECLVELGGRLTQRASPAWMRIEGSGFRSGLGRRVERLLKLDGRAWQPRARVRAWFAKTVGPVLLLAFGLVATAWTEAGPVQHQGSLHGALVESWRHSLVSSALLAVVGDSQAAGTTLPGGKDTNRGAVARDGSAPPQGQVRSQPTNSANVDTARPLPQVLLDGIVLWQLGKLDEAKAKFQQVLKQEPTNATAAYYQALAKQTRNYPAGLRQSQSHLGPEVVQVGQGWNPSPNQLPLSTTNQVHTGRDREWIYAKLVQIKFPETPRFDGVPLSAVVDYLNAESRRRDPDKKGINFFLAHRTGASATAPRAVPQIDPRTGNPVDVPPQEATDLATVAIVLPVLHDIDLAELIDAVCKAAAQPIKYSVEEYAVIFSHRTPEPSQFYTRVYHVDPNTFRDALRATTGSPGKPGPATITSGTQTNSSVDVEAMLRRWLASLGLDFPTNTLVSGELDQPSAATLASSPRKGAFYNDHNGLLFVRATRSDLDIIDQALQVLNVAPSQVTIEARFTEMNEAAARSVGLDHLATPGPRPRSDRQTNAPSLDTLTGILTDTQSRAVIRAFRQQTGVDMLSAPKVTTLSGRQAQVSALDTRTIVTGVELDQPEPTGRNGPHESPRVKYKTSPMGFGPALTVTPTVKPDGSTIQVEINGTVKDFLGYDDPKEVKVPELSTRYQEPLPRYRTREIANTAIVRDGQTIVLAGPITQDVLKAKDKVPVLGDLPVIGGLFRHESTSTVKKRLVIFITPTIVDASGNRVHAEASAK